MDRPVVGVIGAGRVGAVLAAKLLKAGYDVAAMSARSAASKLRVATLAPSVAVYENAEAVAKSCEALLLCVPDDELAGLADVLAPHVEPGQFVLHTSGSHGLAVLEPLRVAGARPIAFHPAMTFTGTSADLDRQCVFGLTAEPAERAFAERLVTDLGGQAMWIADADRTLYHASLVHGSNHLVTLVTQAMAMLRSAGITDPEAVLRPLLTASLDNALTFDTAALTGPVVRGDQQTIQSHLERIEVSDVDDAARDTYIAMARATTVAAQQDGRLDSQSAQSIRSTLNAARADALAALVAGS